MGTTMEAPRCRGSIMIMVTIGMLALFGLAALGLDTGLVLWDKARLQNAVDAAALSGAKVIDDTKGDTGAATSAAVATFNLNANAAGNQALGEAVNNDGFTPTVQFSETLNPFTPDPTSGGPYVRVIANDLPRGGIFSRIFGIDTFNVAATAVAGPSPTLTLICDVAPIMVCGDPSDPDDPADPNDSIYGYNPGDKVELKYPGGTDAEDTTAGNYHLLRIDGSTGGADVREAFAGIYEKCLGEGGSTPTEPGVTAGPVSQGVNTRFDTCSSPVDCDYNNDGIVDILPDLVGYDDSGNGITFDAYKARYASGSFDHPPPYGEAERRILKVPIGDCSTMGSGATTVDIIDIACFFLTQRVATGNNSLWGEFMFAGDGCQAKGFSGPNPSSGPGPYKIQLYKNPDVVDS